jgi:hypothetical protein
MQPLYIHPFHDFQDKFRDIDIHRESICFMMNCAYSNFRQRKTIWFHYLYLENYINNEFSSKILFIKRLS